MCCGDRACKGAREERDVRNGEWALACGTKGEKGEKCTKRGTSSGRVRECGVEAARMGMNGWEQMDGEK